MPNTLLNTQLITFEALRILTNNLKFAANVSHDYDDQFGKAGAKVGNIINVRKPPRFVGRTGQAIGIEALTDTTVPVTLTTQFGVDFAFSSAELKLSIDNFSTRYLKPAMATIASKIDRDGLNMARLYTPNAVGIPGTTPDELITYLQAQQKLDEMACPMDGERFNIISPAQQAAIIDALKGLLQSGPDIAKQYKTGRMGYAIGCEWLMDQNVVTQTVGAYGGTPLVNAANQTGSSLITDGWTATTSVINAGDIITIDGVYAVNPQSRESTGSLQQFVVLNQVTADSGGNKTLTISPSIVPAGQFQNVTNSPADNATIAVLGAPSAVSPTGVLYHRSAYALAMAPLEVPGGVDMAFQQTDPDTNVSLRFVRQYNIMTDIYACRFDVLYGYAPMYPELGCRVQG